MKTRLALILLAAFIGASAIFQPAAESRRLKPAARQIFSEIKPQTAAAAAAASSGRVADFAPARPSDGTSGKKTADEKARQIPNNLPFRKQISNAVADADGNPAQISAVAAMPAPSLSFDGLSSEDNAAAYGFRIVPPDTFSDVGMNHYVQAVNALLRVYDKNGVALTPPFKPSMIFAPLGTPCAARNDGDPIVLYDALADRWMISQFCNLAPPFRQMIAVSKTGDPTGEFYIYEFVMPNIKLNDYSKIGVWSDGYYMTTDQFIGGDYAGTGVFAFDKAKMMRGDESAAYIYFDLASPSTLRLGGLLPTDFDGLTPPPAGAPNIFAGYAATEYGDGQDALRLFDFHADFQNPANSTFAERAESPLSVAAFDPTSPAGRADIAQPPPGESLDSQSDRLMYRLAYRNFGARESLVVNQTVRSSPAGATYRAGVRVYALERAAGGSFGVTEQATFGDALTSRWMGGAAQDHQGNLAFSYSLGSEEKPVSIAYSGKLKTEPAGVFRAENLLIAATGVQKAFGFRWGDYSGMSVDPADDCSFWMTNEYYTLASEEESDFGWLTRIGKFKFAECAAAPRAVITGVVTNAATGQPIAGAMLTTSAYSRTTDAQGGYGNLNVVPGTYALKVSAAGFRSQTITLTVADRQVAAQNFSLQPIAVLEPANAQITAESCAVNHAADPGETVTINFSFRNIGARDARNLTATLLPTGGAANPSAAQNFGAVAVNAVSQPRPFTFTVNPNLACGGLLTLNFILTDDGENLGEATVKLNAGAPRTALTENFDSVAAPVLPNGWSSAAGGEQPPWTTSAARAQSAPNAAFSPAQRQIGVNELISPIFRINSAAAEISFRNWYDLETTFLRNKLYDGAVLEIKIGAGDWQDIETAGGSFVTGGYNGVLESSFQNPLAGRRVWSGKSGVNQESEFITSRAKLPAAAANRDVRLRWRVGTDNGTPREGQYVDDLIVSDGYVCGCVQVRPAAAPFDFDGDGKTDVSVFRPSDANEAADFYVFGSSDSSLRSAAWGSVGDAAVNADYDGDGKTDYAVFRPQSSTWFVLRSSDATILTTSFGAGGDRTVPADYDGDGKADIAVFRPSNGTWYALGSADNRLIARQFGQNGDVPAVGDYDGDGKKDLAVFRPSNGVWYISRSSDAGLSAVQFGQTGDVPVAGDFDGDGKSDFAAFRPANGTWYLLQTRRGFKAVNFGAPTDRPLQADFDGDGSADIGVYRPSNNYWYFLKSSDASFAAQNFGAGADTPVPAIFVR